MLARQETCRSCARIWEWCPRRSSLALWGLFTSSGLAASWPAQASSLAEAVMRTEQSIYEVVTTDLSTLDPNRRFGVSGKPIPATEAYRRVVSTLLRNGIRSERWILIHE